MTALQETGPSVPSSDKSTVRVAVVFGGRSGEHTISCATAAGVLSAIDRDRYEVLPVGVTPEGQWLLVEDDPAALELSDNRPPVTITAEGLGRGRLTAPLGGGELTVLGPTGPEVLGQVDVVLPLLHGPYGEDGTIQGMLEMMGIPYVGCGVLASAAGMDKQVTKVLLGAAGIATAPHVVVGPHAWKRDPEAILEACRSLTYPLFVKPARAGSSLGISKVDRPEDLAGAIEAARAVDPKVLVESGIVGHGPRSHVVLPLLHGPYGEDGTIQGMLEMMGIPYVGCGVLASAAGMDKQVTKVLLGAAGIATAPHVVVGPHAWKRDPEAILEACRSLTDPLFVKPARAGSSLGISKVDRPEDLAGAIEAARAVDPKVLVESGIVGREVEVAVLQGRGDDAPRVAEPGEIAMDASQGAGEFYDYETKYLAHDAVAMVCPARIGPEARDLLMDTAARAFEALGCEGLARVDFFLTDAGEAVVNEINTMPGFTPFSMYPYMWQVSGLGYTELVSELIELAVARSTDVNR